MRAAYAVALVIGTAGVVWWAIAAAIGNTVAGRQETHPERRWGRRGRTAVAGLFGFGMAGISASYAGWPSPAALAAAVAATIALALAADRLATSGGA